MSKELFMAAHEDLIEQYLEAHPEASWDEAYKSTSDQAYGHMQDRLADMADNLRLRAKEGR
jgi:hypothetical protein